MKTRSGNPGVTQTKFGGPNTIIMLRNHGSTESLEQLATITRTSTVASLNFYSVTKVASYTTSTTDAP